MEYGNLVSISQASIARELNLAKSNVSYNFKKLKAKGILIDKDGNIYMNSNLFSKGLAHAMSKENRENLKMQEVQACLMKIKQSINYKMQVEDRRSFSNCIGCKC